MRYRAFWTGVLSLGVLLPALAADDDGAKKTDAKPPSEKLVKLGEVVGRLTRVEGSQKYITVQVSTPVVVPTLGGGGGRYGRPAISFRVQQVSRDIELSAHDDLKVRVLYPPAEFDEKGRPKRYTSAELKELKGPDPKLPGYMADFDSLKPEQVVRVTVMGKKPTMPQKAGARLKTAKDKDVDPEEGAAEEERPFATMIVILAEPVR